MNTELKLPDNPEALRDFARDLVKQLQCLKFENATLLGEKVTLQHEKSLLQEQINRYRSTNPICHYHFKALI